MVTSEAWIDKLCEFEGLRTKAYRCPAGVWTIGYGHTGSDVKAGMVITVEKARELLKKDLKKFEDGVSAVLGSVLMAKIEQNKFDALVDFAYNCGTGNLKQSTLMKKLKMSMNNPTIRDEFMKWNKARVNGVLQPLAGLTRRRQAEADWYFGEGKVKSEK